LALLFFCSGKTLRDSIARAYSALAVTLVLWAGAFPATRFALSELAPEHLMLVRFTLASIVTIIWASFRGIGWPRREDVISVVVMGLVAGFFYQMAFNHGMLAITSGPAAAIVDTAPIFAAVLGTIFLKERVGARGWIGMCLGLTGILLIAAGEGGQFSLEPGALLLLVSAVLFAVNVVMQKPLLGKYSVTEISLWTLLLGTAPMLMFAPGAIQALPTVSWPVLVAVVYLALFPAALAGILWNFALTHLPVARVSSALYLLPPLTFLVAWVALDEIPRPLSLAGAAVALLGVALVQWPVLRGWRREA
jgi:drug/metabolite transporter (DMT)-like permease